ncbi:ABC transporter permease [Anaeromicrobium sediminis]|uniref:Spermidine/putrescine ABC transporter permease n=1 Tax=Anaeromicrobium sediminis TaxID=1478221 RepID=A0A267MCZ1_9FIRM|nr:ABC transporter permease [Anaeromicrobium sediminis]PAB57419.1 spermidine/putrescine ABC transporter permease [Anaeromicrobium sediminis]
MVKALKRLYAGLVYTFLYLPILLLILYSFNDSKYSGKWNGFTLKWYKALLEDSSIMSALYNTFSIAILASIIATIIGTVSAIAIFKMGPRMKTIFMNVTYLPVMNPDIVIGISLLALFTAVKMKLGFITLLLAHVTFNIPYVILAVLPKLTQLNPYLEEAALDLGATPFQAFYKVILPEIMPGIVTGALLSFTLSIDDFMVSFFTTGSGVNTLSIKIYSMTKVGISPKINALSTVLFLGIVILFILLNKREKISE